LPKIPKAPEKTLLYDKGNAPGGLVQHAQSYRLMREKPSVGWLKANLNWTLSRFGRVSSRQLVELGQSPPGAG
jgi:shikimate kinase